MNLSTAQVYPGSTNSLHFIITNSGATTVNAQAEVNISSPENLGGAIISMWAYVDANLALPLYTTGFQPFVNSPWQANYFNVGGGTNTGVWFNVAVTCTSGAVTATQVGFQLTNIAPGATGNVYIDAVTITLPTGPTATPTTTMTPIPNYTWDFENDTLHNTFDTTDSWAMPSSGFISGAPTIGTPGDNSTYCLVVSAAYTGQNQLAGSIIAFGTPINVSTYTGVRMQMWIDTACTNGSPGGVIQVGDGSNYPESSWSNITPGAWTQLDYPISSWGTFTLTNLTMIQGIANTGGSGDTFGTGNVKIDNAELY
jgi:hypothetical protein